MQQRHRVINLVIYNAAERHEQMMRRELERLTHSDVRRLFVSLSPGCTKVSARDGTLHVPGDESFIPGILHKTLEALAYCSKSFEFDFVVRSNISTVIDFSRLLTILPPRSDSVVYASTHVWNENSRDEAFASGTNIILNAAAVAYVLSARGELMMDTIDDVALGMLLRRVTMPQQLSPPMVWSESEDGVVFRNRSADRMRDVSRMARLVDLITGLRRRQPAPSATPLLWALCYLALICILYLSRACA